MSPIVLLAGALLLQAPAARVPGTIRIDGSPERFAGGAEAVVAFPDLRFKDPLYVTYPRDGTNRLCVVERGGIIKVFDNDPHAHEAAVALDLSGKVLRSHDEEGLLGLAFHPHFADNRHLFVMYSAPRPRRNVLSRFTLEDGDRFVVDRTSEMVLMEIPQPYPNHNGGMLEFGPDGYLYVGLGDGGAGGDPHANGQSLSTWLGKILRIDVDHSEPGRNYAIPKDNPFTGDRAARPEIWAYGLRNPWRFSFDRASGLLIAGDVGQNLYEEVDVIKRGLNYGWNAREGLHEFAGGHGGPPFEQPIIEYGRGEGVSVTGGYVYRGNRVPSLQGAYVYGDFDSGTIWALRWDGERVVQNERVARTKQLTSFGEDQGGELYWTSFDGRIRRFEPAQSPRAGAVFPTRLSETGLFPGGEPHPSLLAYDVAMPLWSDGADKQRFVMVPGMEKIVVTADGGFAFPRGTIFVKTFAFDDVKVETRLMINGSEGWAGYTYAWNDEQTDAFLLDGRADKVGNDRTWSFPSRADCMRCHTDAAGVVLGFKPKQLGAQLDRLARLGYLDRPLRAEPYGAADPRAYLDVNCANCHQPGVPARAPIDLRFATPVERMGVVNVAPNHGDLGVAQAMIVRPGKPTQSTLYLRMARSGPDGMPPLSHNLAHDDGLRLVQRWIEELPR